MAADVLKRAKALEPNALREVIAATSYESIVWPVQWSKTPVPNVCPTPLVGGQWRLKDGNKYDIVITDNRTAPSVPAGGKMEPIA